MRPWLIGSLLLVCAAAQAAPKPPRRALEVIAPEPENLQFLSFWVALGAGLFADEGFDVKVVAPPVANEVTNLLDREREQVAVLPPPQVLKLIGEGFPLRVVANLLRNDPIDLIVRRKVAGDRKLAREQPLRARLEGLRGLRLGVAPGPITRLHELFRSVGLKAEDVLQIVVLMGQEQNAAFAQGQVDALYAHTPYLERALVQQDAVLLVDQAGGEVPSLAGRQIHTLVVTERMIARQRDTVARLVRAIGLAQKLIHRDQPRAVAAVLRALPTQERGLTEKLVQLYAAAIPDDPRVSADGFRAALLLFPASKRAPDLSHIDLNQYIDPSFAAGSAAPQPHDREKSP